MHYARNGTQPGRFTNFARRRRDQLFPTIHDQSRPVTISRAGVQLFVMFFPIFLAWRFTRTLIMIRVALPAHWNSFQVSRPCLRLLGWAIRDSARRRKFFDNTPRQIFAVTVVVATVVVVVVMVIIVDVARRRLQYCFPCV